jgi:peptide/nickel transport system permease protein
MWNYLLKRLLIAVPTLLGITVLTFCIIRLAPGDPTKIGLESRDVPYENALTEEWIDQTRKLFGLDRPMLLNLDVKDRKRTVLSLWEDLKSGDADARRELLALGKRLIPHLSPIAASVENPDDATLLLGLLREGAGIEAASSLPAFNAWWKENESSFDRDALLGALTDLETCSSEEAPARAEGIKEDLGALILPVLIARLGALEESPARQRLIALAAPWAGYPRKLLPRSELRRYEEAARRIARWWRQEGLAYREIGGLERIFKTFTETQYALWLWRILHLDFGESFIDFRPVTDKVWDAFKITFSFQIIVIFLIYLISVPLGVYSAVRQDTVSDRVITLALFMLYSLPNFWVAYMLIYLLGGGNFLDIFPIQGLNSEGAESLAFWPWLLDRLWHMCLPLACMTYAGFAVLSRYAKAGMLEVIRQDYIRTARAKGLSERAVVMKHALRNGIIPIVTLLGGLLPALISGSVIIEYIFGIHGMGWLGYNAVLTRDYPLVMAIAFFSALLVLMGTLLSDLLYALVDPRIRFEGGA